MTNWRTVGKPKDVAITDSYATGDDVVLKVPYSFNGSRIGLEEGEAVLRALQRDSLTMGPEVRGLQEEFAAYVGAKHAFATQSCTAALHLGTCLLHFQPGDEVITTPITFIATSLPLLKKDVVPVFADIDPRTMNIDPNKIEEKITSKTRAIYVVSYGGHPVDMDPVMEIARQHKLWVLEDAAHSPGAEYRGRKVGSIADITCFSFHSLKNMTTGEGGMLTTNSDKFAEEAPLLRTMGVKNYDNQTDYWLPYHYDVVTIGGEFGHHYRMDEMRAAIGRVQLRKLDALNAERAAVAEYLNQGFSQIEGCTPPYVASDCKPTWYLYTLRVDTPALGIDRDDFIRHLYREGGVQPVQHYLPNYLFTIYKERGYQPGLCPVAEDMFFHKYFNLPMHPRLTRPECDAMIEGVALAIKACKRGSNGR
jgi:dTDP-4-amino-4,6-dideoxygalactose transaminase